MRCLYCGKRAGLIRRICSICAKVVGIVERAQGRVGLAGMIDLFAAQGLGREQVDRVLDARVGDRPTLRDRMTSDMANYLMRGLGMPGRQSPEDVRRVRMAMQSGTGDQAACETGEKPPGAA